MDLPYAITYIFEDRQWVGKLLPLLVALLLSAIPIFGLLALAVALGAVIEIAGKVREGRPRPLPQWHDINDKFSSGGNLLLAIIAYHLPLILIGACTVPITGAMDPEIFGTLLNLGLICCLLPAALIYTGFIWVMLAVGTAATIREGRSQYFHISHLLDLLRLNRNLSLQWLLLAILAQFATIALALIPCLGWVAVLLFALPVQAHLLGQYTRRLGIADKRPKKRRAPAR